MGKLTGKVAVITAGTSGMALATAKLFVQEGADVYITGRRKDVLDDAVQQIQAAGPNETGGKAGSETASSIGSITGIQGDASKLEDLDTLFQTVQQKHGKIDILFASAGRGEFIPLDQVTEQHFDDTFDLNVRGILFTVQKAVRLFNDGGSIILNGSIAGSMGFPGGTVYAASKAAVRSFARTWVAELKERQIRVNVISPGPIDTPILAPLPKEAIDSFVAAVPLGRIGKPEEIATTALFLASSDSSFVNGVELFVDGGSVAV